jgi:hypothetical protein
MDHYVRFCHTLLISCRDAHRYLKYRDSVNAGPVHAAITHLSALRACVCETRHVYVMCTQVAGGSGLVAADERSKAKT